jgi:putative hydrolase of the HAD superfamily
MAPCRLWIDLDNTLYPASSGFLAALDRRINLFITERYGIPQKDAPAERQRLYVTYGATLLGLYKERNVDYDDYMDFVYREEPARFFPRNPLLKPALRLLPQEKVLFTNSCLAHARKVLRYLQVEDCFKEIFFLDRDFISKPMPESFRRILEKTGWTYGESLLIDDVDRNLMAAKALGMQVLKVNEENQGNGFPCIRHLHELPDYLGKTFL